MKNVFVISDTHFAHHNMYNFVEEDGTRTRHEFANADEADQAMIDRWNSVVKPTDKVYHLGDVFINKKASSILYALNGDKVLIKGNHDIFELEVYTPHFRDIRAYHVLDRMILSHVPIHRDCIARFKGNVHGHLHRKLILDHWKKPDPFYKSACVEHNNYTPVELSVFIDYFSKIKI